MTTQWVDVAAAADVVAEEVLAAVAGGHQIALFRVDDEVFALLDQCSHGYARLSDGYVEDGCVECPLHQGLVDIRTGKPRSAPITDPVRSFPARVVGDRVEVAVEAP
jgi:nitrite reductase/ring-hydroxylating ferredoxin subunit